MKKLQMLFALLLMAALLCAVSCCAATKVDLAPYLSVSYTGTNGEGVARANFDFAAFEYDIMSAWDAEERLEKLADLTAVEMTILPEPVHTENLRNGDTFTVQISFDSKLAKEKGYSFKNLKKTFTVEGLTDAIQIDPFDAEIFGEGKMVSVSVEGVDPFLILNLWNNADFENPVWNIQYRADKDFNFRGDEKITITAELDDVRSKQGYVLSRTETTLSFAGQPRYISSAEDMTEEVILRIRDRAYQECMNGGVANITDGMNSYAPWAVEFSDIHVGETALLSVNNNIEMEYSFLLVPVYKTIRTDEWYDMNTNQNTTMIWEDVIGYYKFTDLIVHSDGSITFNEDYVEMNGNYTSMEVADALYLDQYRANYTFTEVPLTLTEEAEELPKAE